MAARANWFFGSFVADAADQDILSTFRMLFENQIRMVGNLAHLHDETEDIGIVVKHNSRTNVGVEFAGGVGHDARRKVPLDLAEEFIVNDDFLGWKLHRSGMIAFHAS